MFRADQRGLEAHCFPVAPLDHPSGAGRVGALAGQPDVLVRVDQMADQLDHPFLLHSAFFQHTGRHARPFPQKAQKQVLGSHIIMPQLFRRFRRQLDGIPCFFRKTIYHK